MFPHRCRTCPHQQRTSPVAEDKHAHKCSATLSRHDSCEHKDSSSDGSDDLEEGRKKNPLESSFYFPLGSRLLLGPFLCLHKSYLDQYQFTLTWLTWYDSICLDALCSLSTFSFLSCPLTSLHVYFQQPRENIFYMSTFERGWWNEVMNDQYKKIYRRFAEYFFADRCDVGR